MTKIKSLLQQLQELVEVLETKSNFTSKEEEDEAKRLSKECIPKLKRLLK